MKCPICNSTPRILNPELYLYWCDACRHTFAKLPKDAQEKYDESYFDQAHKRWFDHPDYKLFQRVERKLLEKFGKEPVRLLDVGCGRSDFLKWLHARQPDWKLTGIDLAPNHHPGIEFIQDDFSSANIDGPFEIITTFMVVEHVENIQLFFSKMRSLLAGNGILMVNTFNTDSLIFRIARMLNKVGMSAAYKRLYSCHHLQHYSKRSIREILICSGFDIVEHQCHNYPIQAVDVPVTNPIMESCYRLFVGCIFLFSGPLGLGIEHTVYCRPSPRTQPRCPTDTSPKQR